MLGVKHYCKVPIINILINLVDITDRISVGNINISWGANFSPHWFKNFEMINVYSISNINNLKIIENKANISNGFSVVMFDKF